ncbi:unknown [Bacteroides sp. CAG:714]|nr:unknown [Bacteroides sp. CAG:714]
MPQKNNLFKAVKLLWKYSVKSILDYIESSFIITDIV